MKSYQQLSGRLLGPIIANKGRRSAASQLTLHRFSVLIITFIVYATYHASRRPISIVKGEWHKNCTIRYSHSSLGAGSGPTNLTTAGPEDQQYCGWAPFDAANGKSLLGLLDSCYLFTYAFFMFASGYVAERSNLRYFITIWLAVCGTISIAIGLARPLHIHSLWYFVAAQLAMGVAQTSGWPAVVAIVGEWFGGAKKGLIMGVWNWHTSVGNIVGAALAGSFVAQDWTWSFALPGVMCYVVAILVFFLIVPKPKYVGLHVDSHVAAKDVNGNETPDLDDREANQFESKSKQSPIESISPKFSSSSSGSSSVEALHRTVSVEKQAEKAITIWQALLIPGVIEFALCLFFAKLVSYTFLFWLPLYIEETSHLASSTSAFESIMFDVGGCLGSIVAGFLADRTGASAITCIGFLTLAIPSLISYYHFSTTSLFANEALQFIAGAFVNGPYALITTAVSANLACQVPSKSAMATVSAIIDGTGSIGAAIGPLLAPIVSGPGNVWINVFYMCIAADLAAILSLLRIGLADLRRLRARI